MIDEHEALPPSVDDPTRPVTLKDRYRVDGPRVMSAETVTYGAESVATQQPVALAVLRGEAAADPDFVAAVREQACRLAKLACHNRALVRVYETGTTDEGEPYVAREPVDGPSLREVLEARGVLDVHEGLRLAIQVGEGLEALHQSGIVHGELRPESVVLVKDRDGENTVKLGVELTAAHRTPAGRRTRDRGISAYLAPEQTAYADTGEAADVHGLGLLIREMLTGQRPDGRGGQGAGLPPAIARIVAKALEPAPGRRYSSISLMVNDLWSAESEILKSPARAGTSEPARAARKSTVARRGPSDVGMAVALVLALLLVGVTAWVARSDRLVRSGTSESPQPVLVSPLPSPAPPAAMPAAVTPATTTAAEPPSALPPAPPPLPSRSETHAVSSGATPALEDRATVARPATPVPARASRPVTGPTARPASPQPTSDGGDGTAIIDWLLKGGRSTD